MKKHLLFAVAVLLIASAIIYLESTKPKILSSATSINSKDTISADKLGFPKAPELTGVKGYVNSPDNNTSISENRGKVVLVDFWTYTCINCIRTLPYVQSWHEKYAKDGLVIIGVHTPEFQFEKDYQNVARAVEKYGLTYQVVLDNDYATWRAYRNQYWPRKYLIDKDGFIRYDHAGEGNYAETEAKIVELLKEITPNATESQARVSAEPVDFNQIRTPEIYFGQQFRRSPIANVPEPILTENITATIPTILSPNLAYVGGTWKNNADNFELQSENGSVALKYYSKSVNIVAEGNASLAVFLDGKSFAQKDYENDFLNGTIHVTTSKLYRLVETKNYGARELRFNVNGKFKIYAFTFG